MDLMSTLQELRKEMGGPFLDKEENMKLKSEQRKQRKMCERSDLEIMELRRNSTSRQRLSLHPSGSGKQISMQQPESKLNKLHQAVIAEGSGDSSGSLQETGCKAQEDQVIGL